MDPNKIIDEATARRILQPFCDRIGREVKPAPHESADMLVAHMAEVSEFVSIRENIANTRVAIARARRPGSATRSDLVGLESRLVQLESERQRIISIAASSKSFKEFQEKENKASVVQLAEWETAQDVAKRARLVLARDRLPQVVLPKEAAESVVAVLKAIESHVEAAPPAGSLILMGEQPRPSDVNFAPVSAYASGLNPRMFSGSIRLPVALESGRGKRAELDGATSSRDALIMRIGEDRRPLIEGHWEKFDDILPLATRKEMMPIIPACMPFTSPFSLLRTLLSVDSWRAVRNAANDRCNATCVICGMSSSGEVRAEWSFLEPPSRSGAYGIQRLLDVKSYCSACAKVVFPEPADMVALAPNIEGYERSREVYVVHTSMKRLSRINRWDEMASPDPLATAVSIAQAAYQRRSSIRWALDLSILHGTNVSLHPDMVMHRKGWIMRKSDVPLFDNHRSVHLTRIFGAAFVNTDGSRCFFEIPPIHLVPWDTSVEDIWVDDEGETHVPHSSPSADEFADRAGPENPDDEDFIVEEGPPLSIS